MEEPARPSDKITSTPYPKKKRDSSKNHETRESRVTTETYNSSSGSAAIFFKEQRETCKNRFLKMAMKLSLNSLTLEENLNKLLEATSEDEQMEIINYCIALNFPDKLHSNRITLSFNNNTLFSFVATADMKMKVISQSIINYVKET